MRSKDRVNGDLDGKIKTQTGKIQNILIFFLKNSRANFSQI